MCTMILKSLTSPSRSISKTNHPLTGFLRWSFWKKKICIKKYLNLKTSLSSWIWSFRRNDKRLVSFMLYRAEFHVRQYNESLIFRLFESFSGDESVWEKLTLFQISSDLFRKTKYLYSLFRYGMWHTSCCNRPFTNQVFNVKASNLFNWYKL